MAKVEEKVTYNNKVCKYETTIGKLMFYTYTEEERDYSS